MFFARKLSQIFLVLVEIVWEWNHVNLYATYIALKKSTEKRNKYLLEIKAEARFLKPAIQWAWVKKFSSPNISATSKTTVALRWSMWKIRQIINLEAVFDNSNKNYFILPLNLIFHYPFVSNSFLYRISKASITRKLKTTYHMRKTVKII